MAAQVRKLSVSYSENALRTLDSIWVWNAERYSVDQAKRYIQFLLDQTEKLGTDFFSGRAVPTRPNWQYLVIRRRRKGHGHLVVYEVTDDAVLILDYFHTAQDWQNTLRGE